VNDDGVNPRRRLMGIAAALLHWDATTFFRSTPHEFFAAYEEGMNLLRLQQSWATQKPPDF
jgi:hypothetical protein